MTHISFSSALTHLLEQVSKLETAEASCSENNVDFRTLRDCLASYVPGSSTPSKTAGGMDLVLPRASTEQMLQAGRYFLLATIYCLVPPTVQAEDASKTAFSLAQDLFPHALEQLKNHLGVSSFNEIVGRNKRRTIDLLLKKEINAAAMIPAGSDDEWTMSDVNTRFRSPSGNKIYMMILPCATSDTIIMQIMRQMLWCVHRSILAHGMYSGQMPTPLTNPVPDSENSSAVSSPCSSPRDKNQPSEKPKQKPKQGDDSIRIYPLIIESINSTILQQLIVIAATEIPSMPSAGEFDLSRENSTLILPKEELLLPKIYNRFMFLGPGDYHITFLVDAERLKQDPTYIYAVTQLLYYAFGSAVYRLSSVPPASNVFLIPASSSEEDPSVDHVEILCADNFSDDDDVAKDGPNAASNINNTQKLHISTKQTPEQLQRESLARQEAEAKRIAEISRLEKLRHEKKKATDEENWRINETNQALAHLRSNCPRGLWNDGSSCFLNANMVALAAYDLGIVNSVILKLSNEEGIFNLYQEQRPHYENEVYVDVPVPAIVTATGMAFGKLLEAMKAGSAVSVKELDRATEIFAAQVRKDRSTFTSFSKDQLNRPLKSQEDAHEFLTGVSMLFTSSTLFKMSIYKNAECNLCGHNRSYSDQQYMQQISFDNKIKSHKVVDLLNAELSEIIPDQRYTCDAANCAATTRKVTTVGYFLAEGEQLPRAFVIGFKLFEFVIPTLCLKTTDVALKFEKELEVPFKRLYDEDDDASYSERYKLNAIIEHQGAKPNSGHYYTFVRGDEAGDNWLWQSDKQERWYTWEQVSTMPNSINTPGGRPYMLFYQRIRNPGAV